MLLSTVVTLVESSDIPKSERSVLSGKPLWFALGCWKLQLPAWISLDYPNYNKSRFRVLKMNNLNR